MIFHALDSNLVATVLNIVVLTAALSVYNSCVYCNSPDAVRSGQTGQRPESPAQDQQERRAAGCSLGLGHRHPALRADQLPDAGQGVRPADGAGGLRTGDQLGDDQPRAPQVPQGQGRRRRPAQVQGVLVPLRQLSLPRVHGWHPGDHVYDPGFRISVELIPAWLVVLGIGFVIKRKGQAQSKVAANLG